MKNLRVIKINAEISRRINLWLANDTFENMSCGYSRLKFEMQLGLLGYPFEKPEWMKKAKFTKFVTEDEYDSVEVRMLLDSAFDWCKNFEKEMQLSNDIQNDIINEVKFLINKNQ